MTKLIHPKLAEFFSQFETVTYEKNEIIISGITPKGIFYLKKGFVKMNAVFENGKELTLNIYKEGSYFPMFWALTEIPNTYYFQTLTKAQLYCAPKKKVLEFIKKNPDELLALTARILAGVNVLLKNIEYLLSGSARNRVAAAIFLCAKRFGEKANGKNIAVKIPLTHQNIANLAGITRETASIAVLKLQKEKIIIRSSRFWKIPNIKKLEDQLHINQAELSIPQTL